MKQIISVLVLLFVLLSCNKEEGGGYSGDTASLSLQIPMLECETRTPIQGSTEEDAIYELRVIILSQGAKSINKAFTKEQLAQSGGIVNIDSVPVGNVQMYVIANEGALGKDYTNLESLKGDVVDVGGRKKVLVMDKNRNFFPKRRSELNEEINQGLKRAGLPMSWMSQIRVEPPSSRNATQSVQVDLQRCVAKLNVVMESSLSEELKITKINFGCFFGDRLYLFQEENLDVPENCEYIETEFPSVNGTPLDIVIPPGGKKDFVCYIYPSLAWKVGSEPSPYTIGFEAENKPPYRPQAFVDKYGELNSIARNTQVNIYAALSDKANLTINFEVLPWTEKGIDVPSFN